MKYEIELTEEQVAELKKTLPNVNLLEITEVTKEKEEKTEDEKGE